MQPDGEIEPAPNDSEGVWVVVTEEVLVLQSVKVSVPEGELDTDAEIVRDWVLKGVVDGVTVAHKDPVTDIVCVDDPQTVTVVESERLPLPLLVTLLLEDSERVGDTETVFDAVDVTEAQNVTVGDAVRVDETVGLGKGEGEINASVEEADKVGVCELPKDKLGILLTLKLVELDEVVEKVTLVVEEWLTLASSDVVAVVEREGVRVLVEEGVTVRVDNPSVEETEAVEVLERLIVVDGVGELVSEPVGEAEIVAVGDEEGEIENVANMEVVVVEEGEFDADGTTVPPLDVV